MKRNVIWLQSIYQLKFLLVFDSEIRIVNRFYYIDFRLSFFCVNVLNFIFSCYFLNCFIIGVFFEFNFISNNK